MKRLIPAIIFILVVLVVFLVILFFTRGIDQGSDPFIEEESNLPTGVPTLVDNSGMTENKVFVCNKNVSSVVPSKQIIENAGFDENYLGWFDQIWYKMEDDEYDQVSIDSGLAMFVADETDPNSRAGLLQPLDIDVSEYSKIQLNVRIKAVSQSLPGTGTQGREAPVAVGVTYYDQDCNLHTRLPEDPTDDFNRMFWHGFYHIEGNLSDFGTRVSENDWFEYEIDLKEAIDPLIIVDIGVEGAGWAPRSGEVDYVSLVVE